MSDLVIGIALMLLVTAGLAMLGAWLGGKLPKRGVAVAAAITLAATVCFAWFWRDHPAFSRVLPFSNLIVIGNWVLPAAGLLVGLMWSTGPDSKRRRLVTAAPLLVIALGYTVAPLLGKTAAGSNIWNEGVCLQSSDSTCSAACAATLLKHHGIKTSEEEMIELCLTTTKGTYCHGLYRGLKKKAAGSNLQVDLFKTDLDQLQQKLAAGPVIITLALPDRAGVDPRYEREWGWVPGQPHTVVLLAIDGEDVHVGEPAVGPEKWNLKSLRDLWTGEGVRLVQRGSAGES